MNYRYNNLRICVTRKKLEHFCFTDESSFEKAKQVIKKSIDEECLVSIGVNYNEDAWCMDIFSENGNSFIVIYNNEEQVTYNYINVKYIDDFTEIDIAGYECPQRNICDDKDILYEIIICFLKTGRPYGQVEWMRCGA